MAYGDPHYEMMAASQTAASSDAAHALFGTYNGLSTLNEDDAVSVWVEVESGNNRAAITPTLEASATFRFTIDENLGYLKLNPLRSADASQLHFYNADTGADTDIEWIIWRKLP